MSKSWAELMFSTWALSVEASTVIALRTLKVGMGGAGAGVEVTRMVNEKVAALWDIQTKAATGRLGATPLRAAGKTVALYRKKVRANAARLKR